ncbi:MAG: AAA family ATPase [Proteobacteria bacterium]|jgi:MoxR-like ATPase|nr:AAA family ATPase [Pseudomonadota bacterium]MDA1291166.1 AAA family ATPase [Pseudomonadota bacterium]
MTSDSITEVAEPISVSDTEEVSSNTQIDAAVDVLNRLSAAVKQQVLGRDDVIELTLIALVADGHVLLEDFPGSGKTTLAKALGEAIVDDGSDKNRADFILPFRRIQFTPDLLPSDVTGVPVFDSNSNAFHFRHGPLFAHVVLADEINRTSPKVQSAMLEAMGEKQVTVDNVTYQLDALFFVIATQNPLDLVGTYPLPTPQLDRFLFKITMDHIDRESELDVLNTYKQRRDLSADKITVTRDEVLFAREQIDAAVTISSSIKSALVDISRNLREDERVLQGNSTRSMVLMLPALQVAAALRGRDYVSAEDIELLLPRVLGHRIELAPGVADLNKVLIDAMRGPMEQLARGTLA